MTDIPRNNTTMLYQFISFISYISYISFISYVSYISYTSYSSYISYTSYITYISYTNYITYISYMLDKQHAVPHEKSIAMLISVVNWIVSDKHLSTNRK